MNPFLYQSQSTFYDFYDFYIGIDQIFCLEAVHSKKNVRQSPRRVSIIVELVATTKHSYAAY